MASFVVALVVALAALLALTLAERASLWRQLQAQVRAVQIEATRAQLEATQAAAKADLQFLRNGVQVALDGVGTRAPDIERLERERWGFERKLRAAQQHLSRLERAADDGANNQNQRLERRIEIESLSELLVDRQQKLASIQHDVLAARQALAASEQPVLDLESRLEALEPGWLFRLPGGQLFDRDLQIHQVMARSADGEGRRVDRCATCHLPRLSAAQATAEDAMQWIVRFDADVGPRLEPHPRPEISIGAQAPHAIADIGCVACHGGDGRAVDFSAAGHRPTDDQQRQQWRRAWAWRPQAAGRPIVNGRLAQGACRTCHGGDMIEYTPAVRAGAQLVAKLGCAGCHDTPQPADLSPMPKTGPSLRHLASKTTRQRSHAVLANRHGQDASGSMSALWHDVEPTVAAVEQAAVVDFLWQHSEQLELTMPASGNAQRGQQLLDGLGCRACHLTNSDQSAPSAHNAEPADRRRGPSLIASSRLSPDWLFAWLRQPARLRADTLMPDFRLTSSEAADLTAHLLATDGSGIDHRADGDDDNSDSSNDNDSVDAELRDRLALEHLRTQTTIEDADARLEAMDGRQRQLFLGRQTVLRYGCLGCHPISGVDAAPPTGPSLVDLGSQLAQGPEALPSNSIHAATAKRSAPRFALDDGQLENLTAELLGWRAGNDGTRRLAAGQHLIERHGCSACHATRSNGSNADDLTDQKIWQPSQAPPNLHAAGARLRGDWLFDYLSAPGGQQIRPWLATRMPTFALNDRELDAIVRYFADQASVPIVSSPPPPADTASAAVGQVVYQLLQCSRCHLGAGTGTGTGTGADEGEGKGEGEGAMTVAPDYRLARDRLRADWVVSWILDPHSIDPDTVMPRIFYDDGADGDGDASSSYLIGTLGAPMFSLQQQRLRRFFASDAMLRERLSDPEYVAEALRVHLWTLSGSARTP